MRELAVLGLALAVTMSALSSASKEATCQQTDSSVARKVPIYVEDFELYAVPPPPRRNAPAAPASGTQANPVPEDEETPSARVRRLVNFFSSTLLDTLRRQGYSVTRQQQRQKAPDKGVLLRGVFAEPDEQNRIRRSLLGSTATNPKFTVYVGTFNLSGEAQPLYLEAPVQSPDARYGPVITLNAYIPLAKYDLVKDPSEEDMRRVCNQIVAGLTQLLNQNAAAFAH